MKITDALAKKRIAHHINRILAERDCTRYWLAVEIGEHHQTIANICNGTKLCGAGRLARIADALEVSTDSFFLPISRKSKNTA